MGLTQCSVVLLRYCCFDRVAAALRPTNWVTAATLHSGIIHVLFYFLWTYCEGAA